MKLIGIFLCYSLYYICIQINGIVILIQAEIQDPGKSTLKVASNDCSLKKSWMRFHLLKIEEIMRFSNMFCYYRIKTLL